MIRKFNAHIISILFVAGIFVLIQVLITASDSGSPYKHEQAIQNYTELDFLDLTNPRDRILLRESLDFFEPRKTMQHDTLLTEIESYLKDRFAQSARTRDNKAGITMDKLSDIVIMMLKFMLIYILVLFVTYYGVETFAIYRFIRFQQGRGFITRLLAAINKISSSRNRHEKLKSAINFLEKAATGIIKGLFFLTLFAPAYVIAYSFKPSFDTSSVLLMVLLGVISNGLLVTYTQKYFTFLVQESRKGYVQTAIVKNLNKSYRFKDKEGITLSAIFRLNKQFPGHVFDQIYENVRFQYLRTLKEQASYLISGLIIIEMALNIQGHLCYELMQQILYKNFSLVLVIVFGIFLIVKMTEMVIDFIAGRHQYKIDGKKVTVS
jgi:hypothetical protein